MTKLTNTKIIITMVEQQQQHIPPLVNTYNVVIVGGGLSGLQACHEILLNRPNCRVAVVEARDRLGGRVETLDNGLDVGAQWIGPSHFELLKWIHSSSLQLIDQLYPQQQQQRLTECVGFQQMSLHSRDQELVQEYMTLMKNLCSEIDLEAPWNHASAELYDTMSAKDHVVLSIPSSTAAQQEIMLFYQTLLACRVENISFLFLLFYIQSGGGMASLGDGEDGLQKWKLRGGMIQVVHSIKQDLLTRGATIQTNSPVETVLDMGQYGIGLGIRGGGMIRCDRVVFALSPQLIAKLTFTPELPEDRLDLGCAFIPGKTIKIIISFDHPFWLCDDQKEVSDLAMEAFINGPIHNLFHSNAGADSKPALVGLITGAAAEACESLSDQELQDSILQQLQVMYQLAGSKTLLTPTTFVAKRWGLEQFSGGCFAGVCPPNGSLVRLGHLLRAPQGRFHWASTETATKFYGYMEGALLAGKRAADEVVAYYP